MLRVVVLVSGSGTLLQALVDAAADPAYGVEVVAVGADRRSAYGLRRAEDAGVETFVHPLSRGADRDAWDAGLAERLAAYRPDLVVSAGFMKLVGPHVLGTVGGRMINTHPALLPSFPGMHGVRDALAHGVKVTGATVFVVDAGVDSGRILAQRALDIADDDTEDSLHERVKVLERELLVDLVGRWAADPSAYAPTA